MKIEKSLINLIQGKNLSDQSAFQMFLEIFKGRVPEQTVKSILLLLHQKGESASELWGCLKALQTLEKQEKLSSDQVMDNCGTGGDGKGTANISTLAAFVIAGAGGKVAKHGNRSISSQCGSSDLMEALGIRLDSGKQTMKKAIQKCNLGYFHAPFYHPVFAKMQPLRRKLKTRTIFNMLGPLANPFKLNYQMIGVSKPEWVKLFAEVLRKNKVRSALVVHAQDGMDEISSEVPTRAAWVRRGKIRSEFIKPSRHPEAKPKDLRSFGPSALRMTAGSTVSRNKKIALAILRNQLFGVERDTVLLNAAAGLVTLGKAKNMKHGMQLAEASLKSGKAHQVYLNLRELTTTPTS